MRSNFPAGMVIAGIPAGGLDRQTTAQRLLVAYSMPVEVRYNDAVIQIKPDVAGFELDLEGMLTAADQQRTSQPFWVGLAVDHSVAQFQIVKKHVVGLA